MNYSVNQIAEEIKRHRSTVDKAIIKLGIVPVERIVSGVKNFFVYSEEQKEIIVQEIMYKPKRGNKKDSVVYVTENYQVYESKMNYDPTI